MERFSTFARVTPRQKYEILKLLQNKYDVGFLGEGINDAPALKIAIATDQVDSLELKEPKKYDLKEIVLMTTLLGLISTVFDFIFFGLFIKKPASVLRTNWLIGSILTELLLVYSIRTRFLLLKAKRPSTTLILLTGLAVLATLVLPYTYLGQTLFQFTAPTSQHLLLILAVAAVYLIISEQAKLLYYRLSRSWNNSSRHSQFR